MLKALRSKLAVKIIAGIVNGTRTQGTGSAASPRRSSTPTTSTRTSTQTTVRQTNTRPPCNGSTTSPSG